MAGEKGDAIVKSFKMLSYETVPDGRVYVRGVYGTPPLGDDQTHEFEYPSKQAIVNGVKMLEERLTPEDYCLLALSGAVKSDPNLGKTAMDANVGKSATVDLTGAVESVTIA